MSSYRRLPTPPAEYCCAPPFSFFQAVVEPHFRAKKANRYPFHRICTLARRQKANHLVVECALSRPDVAIEIDSLDHACGGGGSAEATLFSFLKIERGAKRLTKRAGAKLLGQAVLINYRAPGSDEFTHSYVFEAHRLTRPQLRRDTPFRVRSCFLRVSSFATCSRGRS
jgi:hypothetical protein